VQLLHSGFFLLTRLLELLELLPYLLYCTYRPVFFILPL
jgi:hypothetical protein